MIDPERIEGTRDRIELRRRGGGEQLVGLLLEDHLARGGVHEQRTPVRLLVAGLLCDGLNRRGERFVRNRFVATNQAEDYGQKKGTGRNLVSATIVSRQLEMNDFTEPPESNRQGRSCHSLREWHFKTGEAGQRSRLAPRDDCRTAENT